MSIKHKHKEAELGDTVNHMSGLETGVVIAKYDKIGRYDGKHYAVLDVKVGEKRIRYGTLANQWNPVNEK